MKVLVTGSNGFLGRHMVRGLLSFGLEPRCMVQPGTDVSCLQELPVERIQADLRASGELLRAVDGCDAVVHLAALVQEWGRPEWFRRVNVEGTRALLDAAESRNVRRFVLMSSLAVHQVGDFDPGDEQSPLDPGGNPYAWSKIRCETLVRERSDAGSIEGVVIRPGMVPFGEDDVRGFGALARAIEWGIVPVVGSERRLTSTVHAPNLGHGVCLALTSAMAPGSTYVITDQARLTWHDYFCAIGDGLGCRLRYLRLPPRLTGFAGAGLESVWSRFGLPGRPPVTSYLARLMTRDLHFTSDKACRELGYVPLTTFQDGMAATCRWWKDRKGSSRS